MIASVAFAPPTPHPAALGAIPCFEQMVSSTGQMRLGLWLPVLVPSDRSDFLERLLRQTGYASVGLRSHYAEPLQTILPARPAACPPRRRKQEASRPPAPITFTPLMLAVERIVARVANARHAMPNNPALGELTGGHCRNTVSRALQRLEVAGRLKVEIANGKRRVVLPDGATTGWGDFATGVHKPYSRTAKGVTPPSEVQRPDYKPDGCEPLRYRIQPQKLVEFEATDVCQWPIWGDGTSAPGIHSVQNLDKLFCNAPVQRNKSYCSRHQSAAVGR